MNRRTTILARALLLLALTTATLTAIEATSTARACAVGHTEAYFVNYTEGPKDPHFYMRAEDASPARATIEVFIHGCPTEGPVLVTWETDNGTATQGSDYGDTDGGSGDLNPPCPDDCQVRQPVDVPIIDDVDDTEPVAEHFRLTVGNLSGRLFPPATVPVYIVEDDGPSRVAFGEPLVSLPYAQDEFTLTARIPVFRAGDTSVSTTVDFSLAGSGANPATAGVDFTPSSGSITFGVGDRLEFVQFTITNDTVVENPEEITATLTSATVGTVATPSQVPFTIIDEDSDKTPPVSKFHHPKHKRTYDYNDYRIREIHTFFKDEGGSGVAKAWLALRLKRKNGRCAWYTGSGFDGGRCGTKRWLVMTPSTRFYLYRVKPLKSSIGTKIRYYRAWTRLMDGAGNKETLFQKGRNLNTFEIRRR